MALISTRNLELLPAVDELRQRCQSIAMLDLLLMPDWEDRYYSFNIKWGENEMLASMRNGSGDSYFILFTVEGGIIKGYAHESLMARYAVDSGRPWPGVVDQVPPQFESILTEPAFLVEETSFCIWRRNADLSWKTGIIDFPAGEDPDGSQNLLFILDGDPKTYIEWGEGYYGRNIPPEPVREIYQHNPLTQELVALLNPDLLIHDLIEDIAEIGYP